MHDVIEKAEKMSTVHVILEGHPFMNKLRRMILNFGEGSFGNRCFDHAKSKLYDCY